VGFRQAYALEFLPKMRRRGLLQTLIQIDRANRRQHAAQIRAQERERREAERRRRLQARIADAERKEEARIYAQGRIEEAEELTNDVERTIEELSSVLRTAASGPSPAIELDTLKETLKEEPFRPGAVGVPVSPPEIASYQPPALGWFARLLPGALRRHARFVAEGELRFANDLRAHSSAERERREKLAALRAEYDRQVEIERTRIAGQHAEIEDFKKALANGDPSAVVNYFMLVLARSDYPDGFPNLSRVAYVRESKQLVVEIDLPTFEVIPEVGAYRYVKSKDEIVSSARPQKDRRALYASVVGQTALRTVHEVFGADRFKVVETVVLNGHVDAIDKGTGMAVRPCIVTVRVSRDIFRTIDLSRVEPNACLRTLHAAVSKSPDELAPVRPVLEFNMVDPRFIEEADVLSKLDTRPNLMELTPGEFENLISNLFEKMGLETRLTRASRDGGVDCVAYDPRPILGGKVVIQAKRYKHTVGVSAVRDLFGTLQNEGASKGILVTTSGYGKAAFEFAAGKPMELLSGSNLLHLLAEHAGLEARIVVPDDWKDPSPDSGEDP
jgi:restriction system protein